MLRWFSKSPWQVVCLFPSLLKIFLARSACLTKDRHFYSAREKTFLLWVVYHFNSCVKCDPLRRFHLGCFTNAWTEFSIIWLSCSFTFPPSPPLFCPSRFLLKVTLKSSLGIFSHGNWPVAILHRAIILSDFTNPKQDQTGSEFGRQALKQFLDATRGLMTLIGVPKLSQQGFNVVVI